MTEIADLLREAQDVVRGGWCRHAHGMGKGDKPEKFCMVGALWQAVGVPWKKEGHPTRWHQSEWEFVPDTKGNQSQAMAQAILALDDAGREFLGSNYHSVPNFNDYYAENVDEVIAVYDIAITKAEAARAGA